jgi:hypothetical protein
MPKTFFGKTFAKIQGFFVTVFGSEKKLEEFLIHHADEAIDVATKVREFIAGPILDGAELVLPDNIDKQIETVRGKVISKIDQVIAKLKLNQACLTLPTFQERFVCFARAVKGFEPMVQNALIAKTASAYTQISAEGETTIKEAIADTAVQTRLFERKIDLGTA